MSFSGSRIDDPTNQYDSYNPYDNGNFTSISLNTTNPKVPGFMFSNGSKIEFKDNVAVAVSNLATRELELRLQWLLSLLMVAVGCIVVFS